MISCILSLLNNFMEVDTRKVPIIHLIVLTKRDSGRDINYA